LELLDKYNVLWKKIDVADDDKANVGEYWNEAYIWLEEILNVNHENNCLHKVDILDKKNLTKCNYDIVVNSEKLDDLQNNAHTQFLQNEKIKLSKDQNDELDVERSSIPSDKLLKDIKDTTDKNKDDTNDSGDGNSKLIINKIDSH